jgi:predicted membrane protein
LTDNGRQPASFQREIKWLLQAGMVIFLVTVIIGMLNGLDVLEFDRPTLMTHVHTGTLGWITLGFFGMCLWLFGSGEQPSKGQASYVRWLTLVSIVSTAFYVYTFYLNNADLRPYGGGLVLLVTFGFLMWLVLQVRRVKFSVPHLAILLAMVTLLIGAVVGVYMQLYLAGGVQSLPSGAFISHPAAMLTGFLILMGMAMTEWGLGLPKQPAPARWSGIAQVVLPFLGGMAATVGALADIPALLFGSGGFQILGAIIFLIRIGPRIVPARWQEGSNNRLFAISAAFVAVNIGLIVVILFGYAEDFEALPSWLLFALSHSIFIGVMTNGLFALIYEVSWSRREFWSWADHILFWGMNVGLVGFVIGLMLQEALLKQIFTPIMGTSILLAIVVYTLRLQTQGTAAETA